MNLYTSYVGMLLLSLVDKFVLILVRNMKIKWLCVICSISEVETPD